MGLDLLTGQTGSIIMTHDPSYSPIKKKKKKKKVAETPPPPPHTPPRKIFIAPVRIPYKDSLTIYYTIFEYLLAGPINYLQTCDFQ